MGGVDMSKSILDGKTILIVDDEPDVLTVLGEEIMAACPNCTIEKAATYESAARLLQSGVYDVVILDIMGVRGFELLEMAVKRDLKVAMLTAHALSPEALKQSIRMKARAYLPKDRLGEIVPFLEDLVQYDYDTGWRRLFGKLQKYFTEQFEENWEKDPDAPWQDWLHGKYL
jgi:DNA-binding NtrC family response regulator